MPSDKTLAALYPIYSVMPCPHKGAEKGAEEKNRPRLRPIMENFTFPRPTGIHSAAQAVGPRVPKAGARVVFRTEPFSDIPPFRGPSPASRPRSKGGAGGHPPHRGEGQAVGTVHVSRTRLFSAAGDDETKFKKVRARVRYVSVPPSDLIGRPPSTTRLTARGLCTTDVKYHNPAPLPSFEPTYCFCPFPLPWE